MAVGVPIKKNTLRSTEGVSENKKQTWAAHRLTLDFIRRTDRVRGGTGFWGKNGTGIRPNRFYIGSNDGTNLIGAKIGLGNDHIAHVGGILCR